MTSIRIAGILTLVLLTVSACAGSDDTNAPEEQPSKSGSPVQADYLGTWGTANQSTRHPRYTFTEDGKFRAFDGCNNVHGTWTFEDPGITITTTGGSTAGCPGFTEATTAVITSGQLTGRADDVTIGTITQGPS